MVVEEDWRAVKADLLISKALQRDGRLTPDEVLVIAEYAQDLHQRQRTMLTAYLAAESHKLRGRPREHAKQALDEADDCIEEWAVTEFGPDWREHEDVLLPAYGGRNIPVNNPSEIAAS